MEEDFCARGNIGSPFIKPANNIPDLERISVFHICLAPGFFVRRGHSHSRSPLAGLRAP